MLNGNKHGKDTMESSKKRDINIWFIATILLAIALVSVWIVKKDSNIIMGADGKEGQILQPKDAANKLIKFFLEAGRAQAAPIEEPVILNKVTDESGMYKVNVTYTFIDQDAKQKKPVSPEFYISQDGKLFIEANRMYDLDKAIEQMKEVQGGSQEKIQDVSGGASPSEINADTATTTTIEEPNQESSDEAPQPQ